MSRGREVGVQVVIVIVMVVVVVETQKLMMMASGWTVLGVFISLPPSLPRPPDSPSENTQTALSQATGYARARREEEEETPSSPSFVLNLSSSYTGYMKDLQPAGADVITPAGSPITGLTRRDGRAGLADI
ncbi:hypothetical protein HOY80DRAFT_1059903 [Tuber brumale]|nr:hypothetical protein HOY80DRAFT_1059903 [Tuber brumale]